MQGIILQAFHWFIRGEGHLWEHVRDEATKLKEMGFTSIWLPPAYKNSNGGHSIGYEPYDLYDLGEFDQKGSVPTKYGNRDQYLEAVKALKDAGLRVMADIVLNHKAGGDEIEKFKAVKVNPNDRTQNISDPFDIEAYTKFTFPGRGKKYSDFIWDFTCFSGVDYAENTHEESIFRIVNSHGGSWQNVVGNEKGNYDYLMFNDIDFRNRAVVDELIRWGKWYYDTVGFNALRLDAVKHISPDFYNEWLQAMRDHAKEDIFVVAEYWSTHHRDLLMQYLEATNYILSLFDAPLQNNFHLASRNENSYDMRNILKGALIELRADKAVTLVSNHDTQPLQALESVVESWFKPLAYALILLRYEGYPTVFYPDLYGAKYIGKGKDGNDHDITMMKVNELENLLKARQKYAYGETYDYFDHKNCIAFVRTGDDHHEGCAVVMSNGDEGFKEMEMSERYASATFIDYLGNYDKEVQTNADGKATFSCHGKSVSVWVAKDSQ